MTATILPAAQRPHAERNLPRYTSYPTALAFDSAHASEAEGWYGTTRPDDRLSVYVHVPFCRRLCWYCGCHTSIAPTYDRVGSYLDVLRREIDLVAGRLGEHDGLAHLHFGGGSPTILKSDDFVRTVDLLKSRFLLKDGAEVAVELDPRTADEAYVKSMAGAGVTRASIGVQDLDPKVQAAINRIQPYEVTERVVGWLRQYGVPEVNIDLIYGLPHQTLDGLLATIDTSIKGFAPRRVALFGYAHVPWMKKHMRLIPDETLPDTNTRWQQYEQGCKLLTETHGYVQIGLDHFAAPDDAMDVLLP